MLGKLKKLFESKEEIKKDNYINKNLYLLIYEIIVADHNIDDREINLTSELIEKYFDIRKDINVSELRKLQNENHFNPDLTNIAYQLKNHLPYEKRKYLILICWQVLLIDEEEDIFETSIVRKIAVLLGIEDNDFISIRNKVKNDISSK